jgi:hypothetical protein
MATASPSTTRGTARPPTGPRATVAYDWSRLGSGTRPASGISNLAGGFAARTHVSISGASWSNVGSIDITGDSAGFIANSAALNFTYRYQDSAAGSAVAFYLDNDTNPTNGYARSYGSVASLASTGATPNVSALQTFPVTWNSAGLGDGVYRVAAQITNSTGKIRYAYSDRPIYVSATGAELISKRFTNDIANSTWTEPRNFTPGGMPRRAPTC